MLISTILIGGSSVLLFKYNDTFLKLLLSFSGAYLFSISVLFLVPEVYSQPMNLPAGIFILIGFFLQILIELFSEGIEHGHIHVHSHKEHTFPLTMMIALSIHSFLEGMPLANNFINEASEHISHHHSSSGVGKSLLIGIILHNIPISIALTSMLLKSGLSNTKSFIWLFVFAIMTPLGTITAQVLKDQIQNISFFSNMLMGLVIGIFLHISTTILFEASNNHKFNLIKFVTIVLGALAAMSMLL